MAMKTPSSTPSTSSALVPEQPPMTTAEASKQPTHLSLFTGIGGIDLAAEWAGFKTILQVEKDELCNCILSSRWPGAARIKDVGLFPEIQGASIDLVSAGWPCQPFSTAARGRNVAADLWPKTFSILESVRPTYFLGENVQRKPVARAAEDLAQLGYRSALLRIPAAAVGAPHLRTRWFLAAHSYGEGKRSRAFDEQMAGLRKFPDMDVWQEVDTSLGMDDGVPGRMDRLRALGNAVVPQQVYPILAALRRCHAQHE